MADAVVIALPVIRIERYRQEAGELVHRSGVDLAHQRLEPSSDRRNVVELWRVREQREYARLVADLGGARRTLAVPPMGPPMDPDMGPDEAS